MRPDQWNRVQDLYYRALELPTDRRRLFLDTTCPHDPEMRQEVESLLQREDRIDHFLETGPIDFLETGPIHALSGRDVRESVADGAEVTDDFIGRIIDDRYLVKQRVGAGGMGIVYRADHRLMGTPVAIKRLALELRHKKEHRQRSVAEARRAVLLDHENIARVKDVVEESDEVFVVMEFIDGDTLKSHLDQPLPLEEFLAIATQCVSALAAAHEKRIAHLDIKPANIMLMPSGRVKICDFGVARQLPSAEGTDPAEETRWTFGGTPSYMAPEVLEGNQFDVQADVFSLGIVFHELLSGTHPFSSDNVRTTTNRILKETPPPLRSTKEKLPGRLIRLVERMLSKEPSRRLTSAETLQELRGVQLRQKLLKTARRAPAELIPLVRRRPVAALSILAAVVLSTTGAAYFYRLAPLPNRKYLAVLPFQVSGDRSDKLVYARGVSEMLAGRLMQITAVPDLQIVSASSIREGNIDTVEKARSELGATVVVEGMFEFSDNQAMFNYFIHAADGTLLRWGTVKTSAADDFDFQDDIIRAVSAKLEIELAPQRGFGTNNPNALSLYREGMGFLSKYYDPENVDAAIDRFIKAVGMDSSYAAAYTALGQAYWYKFRENNRDVSLLDRSLKACQQANSLAAANSDTQVCMGHVYQETGDHDLAIKYFRRAIEYSAANDEAFRSLGSALEEQNQFDEAKKAYLWAIELRPNDWVPYSWIASFYNARHDYVKAMSYFETAQSLSGGKNARVHYSIASAYVNLGQYEMAVQSLEESARLRQNWQPRPRSNLGLVYLMWRKYEKSVPALEEAFKLEKSGDLDTNYRVTGNLARIYSLTGQVKQAREKYELAIEQGQGKLATDGSDHRVHILLGRYYAMLGRRNDAKRHIDVAFKLHSDDPHYLLIAATACVAIGERENALTYMEQAVRLGYTEVQILAEPELDALKAEPRYSALMSSMRTAR